MTFEQMEQLATEEGLAQFVNTQRQELLEAVREVAAIEAIYQEQKLQVPKKEFDGEYAAAAMQFKQQVDFLWGWACCCLCKAKDGCNDHHHPLNHTLGTTVIHVPSQYPTFFYFQHPTHHTQGQEYDEDKLKEQVEETLKARVVLAWLEEANNVVIKPAGST